MTDNYLTTTLGESKTWPFPQLFHGKSVTLLCFADAVYSVDESSYVATLIDTKNPSDLTGGTSKAITSGKDWHFVDAYGSWMLFNDACVVFKTGHSSTVWVQDAVSIGTGMIHKEGRLLLGKFSSSNFYTTVNWNTYWKEKAGTLPDQYDDLAMTAPGANWATWGSFLMPDMLSNFMEDMMIYGSPTETDTGFTTSRPLILDLMERNEAGMRPMPWRGAVAGYLPLGEGVVCYGTDGIRYMGAYNAGVVKTYGVHEIAGLGDNTGVLTGSTCRTAFAGNAFRNVFVGLDGSIWEILPNISAKRLGYSEYIGAMDLAKVLVVSDPIHNEFYISDGSIGYLLTERNALCRCPAMPTSMSALSGGSLKGIKYATALPTTMEVESGTFTSPSGDVETITKVRIIGLNSAANGVRVALKTRCKQTDEFYTSATFVPDARTHINVAIPYMQYRWVVTADVAAGVTLEDIVVEVSSDANPGIAAKLAASAPSAATE